MNKARSTLESARTQRSLPGVASLEQRGLLKALEEYAVALTSQGHPMPYRMRNELVMYRTMFDSARRPTR